MDEPKARLHTDIGGLLATGEGELSRYFSEIEVNVAIGDTKATSHCYVLELDGNGMPPVDDLVKFLASNATDFAITRSKIAEAKAYDARNNATRKLAQLQSDARALFKTTGRSGEGGELLLYLMAQEFLKLPQLISKMPHKTNKEMPVHGTDGIHISVEKTEGGEPILGLYWCESKLYQRPDQAIAECLKDLSEYVLVEGGAERRERDLQLAHDNLGENIANPELEAALIRYLKKEDPLANRVNYRGIGLVGFDFEAYPTIQNTANIEAVRNAVAESLSKWIEKAHSGIKDHKLETIVIHLFVLPLPSVEKFREALKTALAS